MKRQQLTSFYLEALLLVSAFVAMILVLTGVFGAARAQSRSAQLLTQAVRLASNAAEAEHASDSPDHTAVLLDEGGNVRSDDTRLEAWYLSDGSPCSEDRAELRLILSREPYPEDSSMTAISIDVYSDEGRTPLYTLETSYFRKEAD